MKSSRTRVKTAWLLVLSFIFIWPGWWSALAVAKERGALAKNTTWDKTDSPYLVEGDLLVPAGFHLTIKPGVVVQFSKGSSLVIQGDLQAVGTADLPIKFTSSATNPTPGDWGSLRFVMADTTPSYNDAGEFVKGSRLEDCVIEFGGTPAKGTPKEFLGGAIHCFKSSPYLKHLTIRHNRSTFGGGIYCHEFASPYLEDCLFLENEARQSGGGLACFFYSNAVVKHNVFQANVTEEHGGGIYFSFSSPQILDNVIENNRAKYQGGGLYCSNTVTSAVSRVRNNVFLSNQAGEGASNLYVTAKIETIFQENCLVSDSGYDLFVESLGTDMDFSGNYFGPLGEGDLEARVKDRYDDPTQKAAVCDPVMESPPPQTPNAPTKIISFILHGDSEFASDWPFSLCEKAPIYLEVKATDSNPYHADWVPIRLRSSESDSRGVVALAWETGPSTGLFRLKGKVATTSFAKEGAVHARQGEILFFTIEGVEGFEFSRRVDDSRSYLVSVKLPDEADSLHVISHQPRVSWAFRNIFGYGQKFYQTQMAKGAAFAAPPLWDSGEIPSSEPASVIKGVELTDGSTYSLRVRMNSGAEWSDWAEMPLRMNSLPTLPTLQAPLADVIVNQMRPALSLIASRDAEDDPIRYEVQLYQDAAFIRVLAIEKELVAAAGAARWNPPIDLKDDAEYYWRARARDPFETGPWTSAGHFYVNLIEEPPLPFALVDPEMGSQVYLLEPVFSWNKTVDPDPLSSIRYRLVVSPDEKFPPPSTFKLETDLTFLKVDRSLANDANYYWKVEAVDNTQRVTSSEQIGYFHLSTTPSVPEFTEPLASRELIPATILRWGKSVDPNPDDSVSYRVQIADKDFLKPLLDEVIRPTDLSLAQLVSFNMLSDDHEYCIRVRAEDNHGIASHWSKDTGLFFFNKVNTPPRPVTMPFTPAQQVVTSAEPLISWGAASDPDRSDPPNTLSYLLQFDQEGTFQQMIRQVQVRAGVTQINLPGLADNTKWFYRICARDDEGTLSPYSSVQTFILNTKNDSPATFSLSGPENGMNTYRLSGINLAWQATTDIDPGDQIHYVLFVTPAEGGPALFDAKRVEGTNFQIIVPLKNATDYLWWVEAEDLLGARTPASEKFHFTVNTTPTTPQVAEITEGILTGKQIFRWQLSSDPDPADPLTYEAQIVSSATPQTSLLSWPKIVPAKAAQGIAVAEWRGLKALKDNQKYAFSVRAVDPHNAVSPWSEPLEFTLDLQNEAPPAPVIAEPSTPVSRSPQVTVSWLAAVDPDPSDHPERMSYRLQIVKGESFNLEKPLEWIVYNGTLSTSNCQLSDNQLWSLRVRSEDGRGGISPWSAPVKVVVNVNEDPPTAPDLRTPNLGAKVASSPSLNFTWSAVHDPDFKASVQYEIRYWPADQPDKAIACGNLKGTTYRAPGLEKGTIYQWQVTAMDETGMQSASPVGTFTVVAPPPPTPNMGR